MMKTKQPPKIGKDANWLGEMNRPKFFTKYTLPGLLYLFGSFVWKAAVFALCWYSIAILAQLVLDVFGFVPLPQPLTIVDRVVVCTGVLLGVACAIRIYLARKRKRNLIALTTFPNGHRRQSNRSGR